MDPSDVTQIIFLIILIALSAFFSSSETALTAVNKIRLRSLAEEGVKGAKITYKLIEDPTKMLGAILIGNNVVNILAASQATTLAINMCQRMGMSNNASVGIGIANGVITILILIFGEITPKSLATLYAEQISLKIGGIIYYLGKILTPVIFIVNKLSIGLLMLFRIDTTNKVSSITENELRTLVDVSHEEGVIESEERRMITNVVDFGDSLAKDVMVPHIDMEFVNVDDTYDELVAAFEKEKFSRLPVYDETKDNVIGIINLKDVFFYKDKPENFHIREHMREPYFTYEFQKTSELLIELRKASAAVAIVLDEYGATAGLITLEDLLEEIVGEIRDEYDDDEVDPIQSIGEDEYMAEGTARLDEINEAIGLSLESDDYDSIAGHIINLLEHLPKKGESVQEGNILYTVEEMDKNRIDKVRIKRFPIEEKEDED
ncbi:MAG: HlyC/CorC family transporter [Acetivibrio ethanolgignens]